MKKTYIAFVAAVAALPIFAKIEMGAPFTDGVVLHSSVSQMLNDSPSLT